MPFFDFGMDKAKADFDVLIIGGGPGGLSAALWCSDLGLTALLLEKESELGGQLLITHNPIMNYLGVEAKNGRELRDIFARQVYNCKTELRVNADVIHLDPDTLTVSLADGSTFTGRSIIIATGVRRRKLNIPGEIEFIGRGILESGVASKGKVAGKQVIIIGGGDAALENALILSKTARKVTVIHRREIFKARLDFIESAKENGRIELMGNAVVTSINGSATVESVEIAKSDEGTTFSIAADAVLIRIGVEPNDELFRALTKTDGLGVIGSDNIYSASDATMFAIGDVINATAPTLNGAAGDGATAVKTVFNAANASKKVR